MRLRKAVFFQIALLMLLIFIPAAVAAGTGGIDLSLSTSAAPVGESVTASGKTAQEAWVPLKVVDEAGNIVVFDATKSGSDGNYSIDFKVPEGAADTLTVVVGEGSKVSSKTLTVGTKSSSSSPGGGGGSRSTGPDPVTSTTGKASVSPDTGGTIGLGDEATIEIPAGALTGTEDVEVKIERVAAPPAAPAGFRLLGVVYEFSVGDSSSYSFAEPVTLTFTFDPEALGEGEIPTIQYYDADLGRWINLGGEVTGNTISIQVDHLTKFSVMAGLPEEVPLVELTDIAGHWAEATIKELVALGIISGYPDGTFKPGHEITRAEFAALAVRGFGLELRSGKVFADTAGHWAEEIVATAAYHGIVKGYSEEIFSPDDLITREQMVTMIVRASDPAAAAEEIPFTDSGSISGWAREAVAAAVQEGTISGYPDNTFRPQGNATRAEAVTVVANTLPE